MEEKKQSPATSDSRPLAVMCSGLSAQRMPSLPVKPVTLRNLYPSFSQSFRRTAAGTPVN